MEPQTSMTLQEAIERGQASTLAVGYTLCLIRRERNLYDIYANKWGPEVGWFYAYESFDYAPTEIEILRHLQFGEPYSNGYRPTQVQAIATLYYRDNGQWEVLGAHPDFVKAVAETVNPQPQPIKRTRLPVGAHVVYAQKSGDGWIESDALVHAVDQSGRLRLLIVVANNSLFPDHYYRYLVVHQSDPARKPGEEEVWRFADEAPAYRQEQAGERPLRCGEAILTEDVARMSESEWRAWVKECLQDIGRLR